MKLSIIVAVADNHVIGSNQGDPSWLFPADLAHFRKTTMGHPVIIGRATYEKIGKPLEGRRTVILTRHKEYKAAGCEVVSSVDNALELLKNEPEIFISGGGEVYKDFLPKIDYLYVTEVHAEPQGNITFEFDRSDWQEVSRQYFEADSNNPLPYSFVEFTRK